MLTCYHTTICASAGRWCSKFNVEKWKAFSCIDSRSVCKIWGIPNREWQRQNHFWGLTKVFLQGNKKRSCLNTTTKTPPHPNINLFCKLSKSNSIWETSVSPTWDKWDCVFFPRYNTDVLLYWGRDNALEDGRIPSHDSLISHTYCVRLPEYCSIRKTWLGIGFFTFTALFIKSFTTRSAAQ